MRANKYTYIVDYDDNRFVIFNGVSKLFMLLDKSVQAAYESMLASPQEYELTHPGLIAELQKNGFIVDDDYDEYTEVRSQWADYVNASNYRTVILPTYECNYRCWYCTQKHEPVEIDYGKLQLIVKHIKKYLIENDIKEYSLSWFGGEPLTQPAIIDSMSTELIAFCKEHDIEYTGGITTNGALLNPENIELLKRAKVRFYQIAIDGDKKSHDKNKFDSEHPSSFELVLSNMANLAKMNSEAYITLRLNITPAVINDTHLVDEINMHIPAELRSKIFIDIHNIWQISELNYDSDKLKAIHKAFAESGYTLSPDHIFSICYVDKLHYSTIFYNGKVEMCDNRAIEELRGTINEEGDIEWNEATPLFKKYPIFNPKSNCNKCSLLPLCFGGCPVHRDTLIDAEGNIGCMHKGSLEVFEHRIKDFCSRVINNHSCKTGANRTIE